MLKTSYEFQPRRFRVKQAHEPGSNKAYDPPRLKAIYHSWELTAIDQAKKDLDVFQRAYDATPPPVMRAVMEHTDSSGEFVDSRTQDRLQTELESAQRDLAKARAATQGYEEPVQPNPDRIVIPEDDEIETSFTVTIPPVTSLSATTRAAASPARGAVRPKNSMELFRSNKTKSVERPQPSRASAPHASTAAGTRPSSAKTSSNTTTSEAVSRPPSRKRPHSDEDSDGQDSASEVSATKASKPKRKQPKEPTTASQRATVFKSFIVKRMQWLKKLAKADGENPMGIPKEVMNIFLKETLVYLQSIINIKYAQLDSADSYIVELACRFGDEHSSFILKYRPILGKVLTQVVQPWLEKVDADTAGPSSEPMAYTPFESPNKEKDTSATSLRPVELTNSQKQSLHQPTTIQYVRDRLAEKDLAASKAPSPPPPGTTETDWIQPLQLEVIGNTDNLCAIYHCEQQLIDMIKLCEDIRPVSLPWQVRLTWNAFIHRCALIFVAVSAMRQWERFNKCQKKLYDEYLKLHQDFVVLFEDFAPCTPVFTFVQARFRELWNLRTPCATDPAYYLSVLSTTIDIGRKAYLFRIDPKVQVGVDICRRIEGQLVGIHMEHGVDGTDLMKSQPLQYFPFEEYKVNMDDLQLRRANDGCMTTAQRLEYEKQKLQLIKLMNQGHLPACPDHLKDEFNVTLKKLQITRVLWERLTVKEEACDETMMFGRKVVIYEKTIYAPAYFNVVYGKIPDDANDKFFTQWQNAITRWEDNHQKPLILFLQKRTNNQAPSGCRTFEDMLSNSISYNHILVRKEVDKQIAGYAKQQQAVAQTPKPVLVTVLPPTDPTMQTLQDARNILSAAH